MDIERDNSHLDINQKRNAAIIKKGEFSWLAARFYLRLLCLPEE